MKNSFFSKFAKLSLALLFVSCIAFVACKPELEVSSDPMTPVELSADDALIGTWSCTVSGTYQDADGKDVSYSYTETYTITQTTFDAGANSYAGDNLKVIKTSKDSGYIYIKYTRAPDENWIYSETTPNVGKWYAISYKNLTDNSISLSGAYKQDGIIAADTIKDAYYEFTIDNGYFGTYSELTKQTE